MIRVVIFGKHSAGWMEALNPSAFVWRGICDNVQFLESIEDLELLRCSLQKDERFVVIPLLESHIKLCTSDFPALVPSPTALEILEDKAKFFHYCLRHALDVFCPRHFESIDALEFPVVLKRTNLNATGGITVAHSPEELRVLLAQRPWVGHSYVLQEYIEGSEEFVSHLICENGRVLWDHTVRYGGVGEQRIVRPKPVLDSFRTSDKLLRIFEKILLPLNFSGPCNIDYKIDPLGRLRIFEVNPRLGGSLMRYDKVEVLRSALDCIVRTTLARPGEFTYPLHDTVNLSSRTKSLGARF